MKSLSTKQFGPRASAYVASAVHATGEDLIALARLARGHRFERALDLGCGGGHASFTLAPHVGEVTAFDLSSEMLGAMAQEASRRGLVNVRSTLGSVENLPFDDGLFDLVVTRFSAHHWLDVPRALTEARRVLRPNGCGVFMDVFAPEQPLLDTFLQTIEMLRDPSHVRDYCLSEWREMLQNAKFSPLAPCQRKLATDFASWIARMDTPEVQARAILALQNQMPDVVRAHFGIEVDGSFQLDTMTIEATPI